MWRQSRSTLTEYDASADTSVNSVTRRFRLRNLFRPTYLILALRAEETRHLGRYHHFVTDEFSYGLAESSVIVPHAVLSHQNTLF